MKDLKGKDDTLKGGVLVIGSLLWENEENALDKAQGILRADWRSKWLDLEKAISVKCPIRYGRISHGRRSTYTMLFSNSTPFKGNALLIPFIEETIINEDFSQITEQAIDLSRAEGIAKRGEVHLYKKWGTIALCITQQLEQRNAGLAKELAEWWTPQFRGIINPQIFRIDVTESPCITQDALINFPIEPDDIGIDYFFCTPVIPEMRDYPTPEEIAQRIIDNGYSTYFFQNQKYGLTTFQDREVLMLIKKDGNKLNFSNEVE